MRCGSASEEARKCTHEDGAHAGQCEQQSKGEKAKEGEEARLENGDGGRGTRGALAVHYEPQGVRKSYISCQGFWAKQEHKCYL